MLELNDFIHLPALDPLIGRLLADDSGLTIVAGLDPRPEICEAAGVPGSGRTTIFRILVRQLLESQPQTRAHIISGERGALRVARRLRNRVVEQVVQSPGEVVAALAALSNSADTALVVIEHIDAQVAGPALAAARAGQRILAQLETAARGPAVARQLVELGAAPGDLDALRWALAVQRLPALCPHCRAEIAPDDAESALLAQRWPKALPGPFFRAAGCDSCQGRGRQDTIAAFDLYCRHDPAGNLPLEEYLSHLAQDGRLALDDLLYLHEDEVQRHYRLFTASERALSEARSTVQLRRAELEGAYRVAQQRTEALISLQAVGEALASTGDLRTLAHQICVQACELSGGDYALLYLRHEGDEAEILASHGWDLARIESPVRIGLEEYSERSFDGRPPGIGPLRPGVRASNIRGGLFLPLLKQGEPAGALLVQSARKNHFAPGEISLLRGLAALAIVTLHRAGLIDLLQQQMAALAAAHEGLAQKERMERELELARAVQQRMLPRAFPQVPGYDFASYYRPAREVGGDFYDAFLIDDEHIAVAVGDVSDKGMPAALYMALTRSLLRAEGTRARSPLATLARVNQLLIDLGEPDMFVTVFYGILERSSRLFTYCRAGHERPFLLRDGQVTELPGDGMALGLVGAGRLQLTEAIVPLAPGDRLLLYSDGLSDVQSPAGDFFERERLAALIEAQAEEPGNLCNTIFDALIAFQGDAAQFDDMALLVVEVS